MSLRRDFLEVELRFKLVKDLRANHLQFASNLLSKVALKLVRILDGFQHVKVAVTAASFTLLFFLLFLFWCSNRLCNAELDAVIHVQCRY